MSQPEEDYDYMASKLCDLINSGQEENEIIATQIIKGDSAYIPHLFPKILQRDISEIWRNYAYLYTTIQIADIEKVYTKLCRNLYKKVSNGFVDVGLVNTLFFVFWSQKTCGRSVSGMQKFFLGIIKNIDT